MLGVAGEMGSGKGLATELVKQWYPGTQSFRFSDSLREFYRRIIAHVVTKNDTFEITDEFLVSCMLTDSFGSSVCTQDADRSGLRTFIRWLIFEFIPKHGRVWTMQGSTIDLQDISTAVRQYFGSDILERAIIARVNASTSESPIIILDGIRRPRDIATLVKDSSVSFGLLYIEVDAKTRYERHKARAEKPGDAELTFEQFLALGSVEAEREIVRLRPLSNAIIDNSGEFAHLEGALRMLIEGWLVHGTENRR